MKRRQPLTVGSPSAHNIKVFRERHTEKHATGPFGPEFKHNHALSLNRVQWKRGEDPRFVEAAML